MLRRFQIGGCTREDRSQAAGDHFSGRDRRSRAAAKTRVKLITLPARRRVETRLDNPHATLVEEERVVPLPAGARPVEIAFFISGLNLMLHDYRPVQTVAACPAGKKTELLYHVGTLQGYLTKQ